MYTTLVAKWNVTSCQIFGSRVSYLKEFEMSRRARVLRYGGVFMGGGASGLTRAVRLGLLAVLMTLVAGPAGVAQAQLTVLSQGNRQTQWKKTQMESLQQQLAAAEVSDALESELQSQLRWLKAWEPGGLSEQPLWEGAPETSRWEEPSLDPAGLAGELRERLLGSGATPTAADTQELKELLASHPQDLGVRQLHLHWLDQPQYRKLYTQEIAEAAAKVLSLLNSQAEPDPQTERARIFCLYRRGQALVYRELPDVLARQPMDENELKRNAAELLGVHRELKELVPEHRPEFVLLDDRMLRRDHWYGRALVLLEDFGGQISLQWYLKKRRDILRELGWDGPAEEAAAIYAAKFPEAVAEGVSQQ